MKKSIAALEEFHLYSYIPVADKQYFYHRLISPYKSCISSQMPNIAGFFGIFRFLCFRGIFSNLSVFSLAFPCNIGKFVHLHAKSGFIVSSFFAHRAFPFKDLRLHHTTNLALRIAVLCENGSSPTLFFRIYTAAA